MEIHFRFDPEKTVEATAFLLKLHGEPINSFDLLKMLYMADRIALQTMDQPITGDQYISTDCGPVLSTVYYLIQGKSLDEISPTWEKFIAPCDDKRIYLVDDPGVGNLCDEEEGILKDVYYNFIQSDSCHRLEWGQNFPEWKKSYDFSYPSIPVERILKVLGKTDHEINSIRQEALREAYLDEVLSG
ncbi:Panacea domain-containing protein [Phormidium sp. FACHB-1136]|uniref:Panacea domain-containing protein n=1 Tax=Phormidium sp. FACHB-1136 TaxID=2692848 RepID=UPI001682B1D0|nr:Panacea domain-containing protein [Phormidium sp. FACHB-1136]MBD2427910.1 SocA family protein [Phormidium sp. FACHB-1136]